MHVLAVIMEKLLPMGQPFVWRISFPFAEKVHPEVRRLRNLIDLIDNVINGHIYGDISKKSLDIVRYILFI